MELNSLNEATVVKFSACSLLFQFSENQKRRLTLRAQWWQKNTQVSEELWAVGVELSAVINFPLFNIQAQCSVHVLVAPQGKLHTLELLHESGGDTSACG